jgi:hypothetical protein
MRYYYAPVSLRKIKLQNGSVGWGDSDEKDKRKKI